MRPAASIALILIAAATASAPLDAAERKSSKPVWSATPATWTEDGATAVLTLGAASQRFVRISAGTYQMGAEPAPAGSKKPAKPGHPVTLTKDFWLATTECSQAMWIELAGPRDFFTPDPTHPCNAVNFPEAAEFCTKLTEALANPALIVGLPTDAQWEYACRAGTTTVFSFGDTLTAEQANFNGAKVAKGGTPGPNLAKAVACGSLPANAWGLHEMHGNVGEWVADGAYVLPETAETDPLHLNEKGRYHVWRGGSWADSALECSSAARQGPNEGHNYDYLGFRLAVWAK
jgi:formylglycine-generating enzyme required for sulfatase activity